MRRQLVVAGSVTVLLAQATGVAAAHDDDDRGGRGHVVVAAHLDNPRQLNWAGSRLLVAEGGRGGSTCDDEGICTGFTGEISAVDHPFRDRTGRARTVVDDLFSNATPEATIGSDGVAWTGFPGVYLIAQGEPFGDALSTRAFEAEHPGARTQEHLLISVDGRVFRWVDLGREERRQNPDRKKALDSNPNSVIVVDPTPKSGPGRDEYALVADAGANTVWKVDPDFTRRDRFGLPRATVTVFAAFRADDDPATPEFVPSALDQDEDGNIYVGGVGSFVPGGAAVVRFDADGHRTGRWGGFTAINGLAVEENGRHLYVSQILEGNVIRVDTKKRTWTSFDVPFPSGLALGEDARRGHGHDYDRHGDRDDAVFVSAYSILAGDADDPATEVVEGGQVWRFEFPRHAKEKPLPVTRPGA